MAGALLLVDVFTVFWRAADEDVEEVLLDFFSIDLNEVVEVVVDFFWTVWVVFFLLT